jgi:hypothetical protein
LAWTDKFGGIWGILSQFISTHFQPILVLWVPCPLGWTWSERFTKHGLFDLRGIMPVNISNFKPNSSGRKKKHFCSRCSASYHNTRELTDHIKSIHKGLRPYNCSICDSKFSYRQNLKYHEKAVHGIGKSSNGFQCPQWSDCFFQESRLIQHMNAFHSDGLKKK